VDSRLMETRQSFLIPFGEVLDIYHSVPGEGFCPFIKYENEKECYAFSGWSYLRGQAPGHKVQEWKLPDGEYTMEVELVFGGKRSHKERFLVINKTTRLDGVKLQKIEENNIFKRWRKYSWLPFVVAATINVGLIMSLVMLFEEVTLIDKAAFITKNLAGTIALAIPFFETTKKWVKISVIIAIELFIAGMFFQAINIIV